MAKGSSSSVNVTDIGSGTSVGGGGGGESLCLAWNSEARFSSDEIDSSIEHNPNYERYNGKKL